MGKKKIKNEDKESVTGIDTVDQFRINIKLHDRITDLEHRIDRIVAAHDKCKSLKGL